MATAESRGEAVTTATVAAFTSNAAIGSVPSRGASGIYGNHRHLQRMPPLAASSHVDSIANSRNHGNNSVLEISLRY